MNYAEIKTCDIANGIGVRVSLFVSGCRNRCKNCFNKETWDFNYGKLFTEEIAQSIFKACEPDYITGLTILGGEPFEPENQAVLVKFTDEFRRRFLDSKTIWCYSGYTYELLTASDGSHCRTECTDSFLENIDVLVDGRYEEELHDITLRFRGSSNQRIIDMKKTRENGQLILWQDDAVFATHEM